MIENLLYTALATLIVIVILHIGVFWVSRVIQPPKARVVYMPQPVYNTLPPAQPAPQVIQQQQQPPLMQPHPQSVAQMAPPPPEIKLPTYDSPPAKPAPPPALPPPIETRDPARA
jgi:hypothetical protein